jgi:hypothetical protein
MSAYTDNLEAAVARADAAERKLEDLKREMESDEFQELDPICPPPEFFSFRRWVRDELWRNKFGRAVGIVLIGLLMGLVVGLPGVVCVSPTSETPQPGIQRFQPGQPLSGALQSENETSRYHETCGDHNRTLRVTARAETAITVVRVWRRGVNEPMQRLVFLSSVSEIQNIFVGPGCTRLAVHGYNTRVDESYPANSSNTAGLAYELRVW